MSTKKYAVILVVITFLLVILIYSSVARFNAFALEVNHGPVSCVSIPIGGGSINGLYPRSCCVSWYGPNPTELRFIECQTCYFSDEGHTNVVSCDPIQVSSRSLPTGTQPPLSGTFHPPSAAGHLNGGLTSSSSNSTNSTAQPSSGLLNGRIPTTNTFNAPITTTGGNTSNPNNGTTTAMKATRGVYSPTGGCDSTRTDVCFPCDPGIGGASCIPSSDWPAGAGTGTSAFKNKLGAVGPPANMLNSQTGNTLQQQPPITPPPTTNQQSTPTTTTGHHHKGSNNNLQGGQESTPIPTTK